MKWRFSRFWLLGFVVFVLAGCGHLAFKKYAPEVPIASPPLPPTPTVKEGSLWNGRQPDGLASDNRASSVGDLVTISITETSKASEIANTKTSRDSGVKVGIGSLFGLSFPMKSFTDKDVEVDTALEGTVGNVSKGEGKTERQSSFTSFLTARVVQVLPNRNLVIQGRRHLRINNETEVMILSGIVRPEDIDRNNVVPSTKVAEPRMVTSGVGVVSDKQRVGWGQRIIDHIWPF